MLLIRLSGHSGAGKTRLLNALPEHGLSCPRAILYTSRVARVGESHGRDYYFLSRAAIANLPDRSFYVGPLRDMLQAVDLDQLELDLRTSTAVLIEINHRLWPEVERRMKERLGGMLTTTSVFMTAVDPKAVATKSEEERRKTIREEVATNLKWREKDPPDKIPGRAESAIEEIEEAVLPRGENQYSQVFHSSPEGPDGEDDWTREEKPVGNAKWVLDEFLAFVESEARSARSTRE